MALKAVEVFETRWASTPGRKRRPVAFHITIIESLAGSAQYRCHGVADYEQAFAWHPNRIETTQGKEEMKRHLERSVLAVAVSSCLLASTPALAITNVEANAGPQFNFVNPGARSLGMGGAFIGLADDSTAAYTNPAGLGQLSRKEIVAEGRYTQFSTLSADSGRLIGSPTGIGQDTVAGIQTQDTTRDISNLAFLSFALPLEHGTLAFYRHELANFGADFASNGPFVQTLNAGDGEGGPPRVQRLLPTINNIRLKIADYGFAGSWHAGSKVLLGGSLNYYRFDFDTLTRRYGVDANHDGVDSPLELLTVTDFSNGALRGFSSQHGNDGAFGFNVGILWQPVDRWSLGMVYRRGPEFDYQYSTTNVGGAPGLERTTTFKVPDTWGIGLGYRPSDAWRISFDFSRVMYSQHADHVVEQGTGNPIDYLNLNNTNEARVGAEYTAINATHPYNIRFGAWHEPAHQMFYDGVIEQSLDLAQRGANAHAALFVRSTDAWHGTFGYGVVFNKFQLDTAVDISPRVKVFSLSLGYYLK
jgi:long-subunit fatty acid transport protein